MDKTPELYDRWNEKKKSIETGKKHKIVRAGELWICNIGVNVGSEISKDDPFQRPVCILATHLGGDLVLVAPTSTQFHERFSRFLIPFSDACDYGLDRPTYFVTNQVRVLSMKRLIKKLNNISVGGHDIPVLPHDRREEILGKYIDIIKKSSLGRLDLNVMGTSIGDGGV